MVHLCRGDSDILNKLLSTQGQLSKLSFCLKDMLAIGAGDNNLVNVPSFGAFRMICMNFWKNRWKINSSISGRFGCLNLLSSPPTYEGVKTKFKLHGSDVGV